MGSSPIKPVLLTYGGAEKMLSDMTDDERKAVGESIRRRAKEKAFSKGLPIYYTVEGRLVAEFPDGHTEFVSQENE